MPSADSWAALWNLSIPPVLQGTTAQASRGKRTGFLYTTAGFTLPDLDGYGLRHQALTRPTLAPSYPVPVRRLVRLFHTSFRPHLTMTPLCFPNLHLHLVGGGTFTLLVSARARHAPSVEPTARRKEHCGTEATATSLDQSFFLEWGQQRWGTH